MLKVIHNIDNHKKTIVFHFNECLRKQTEEGKLVDGFLMIETKK